jgi:hypothetical protein
MLVVWKNSLSSGVVNVNLVAVEGLVLLLRSPGSGAFVDSLHRVLLREAISRVPIDA